MPFLAWRWESETDRSKMSAAREQAIDDEDGERFAEWGPAYSPRYRQGASVCASAIPGVPRQYRARSSPANTGPE